jgi:hypothetical protein
MSHPISSAIIEEDDSSYEDNILTSPCSSTLCCQIRKILTSLLYSATANNGKKSTRWCVVSFPSWLQWFNWSSTRSSSSTSTNEMSDQSTSKTQFILLQMSRLEANTLAHHAMVKEFQETQLSHHLAKIDAFALRFQPSRYLSKLQFKLEMQRGCKELLEAGEKVLRSGGNPKAEWIQRMIKKYGLILGNRQGNLVQKSIETLTYKLGAEADLMIAKLSNKLDQLQFQFEMEYANHEKMMMERETAHTVKNLNTTAHHELLNLLELDLSSNAAGQVRQILALMITAAHQTYQLSRVGEIVRGEEPQLKDYLVDATMSWSKICGHDNFCLDEDSKELIVDGFRIIAVLANAWNNALNHGDSTRMNENKMYLCAAATNLVKICIVNRAQKDAPAFDHIEECEDKGENEVEWQENEIKNGNKSKDDFYSATEINKSTFQSSPGATLTTRMGLSWIKKLCQGRVKLKSEGNGGLTTLTCYMEADHCRLPHKVNRKNNFDSLNQFQALPNISSLRLNSNLNCGASRNSNAQTSNYKIDDHSSKIFLWDAKFVHQVLETYGIVVVEDSKALAIQIKRGLISSHQIHNVQLLCGNKATRYNEICELLENVVEQQKLNHVKHSNESSQSGKPNPILIVIDRNLGHGLNEKRKRVAMPNGDIVAANMRQRGYNGCLALHTGDSADQLKMYELHYKNYYIDMVLDKHHVPSYLHIYECFSSWVYERFRFGTFMVNCNNKSADVVYHKFSIQYDICLSARKELLQTNNLLVQIQKIEFDSTKKDNILNKLLCTVRCLQTTMQLLGATKISNLCQRICVQFKRGTLLQLFCKQHKKQKNGQNSKSSNSEEDLFQCMQLDKEAVSSTTKVKELNVLEPTLVDLFTRETSVMQKFVDVACTMLNEKIAPINAAINSIKKNEQLHEDKRNKGA